MSYQYDAFFSYKRDPQSDLWHQMLKSKIQFWVGNELGTDPQIFFDTESIEVGELWRDEIGSALKKSKCIICIWSPRYFNSKWCLSEWKTFEQRSKRYDSNLISPARYNRRIPDYARHIQGMDMSEYASTIEAFWGTTKAVQFEENCIRPFAISVSRMIINAPPFDPNFPLEVVVNQPAQPKITRLAAG